MGLVFRAKSTGRKKGLSILESKNLTVFRGAKYRQKERSEYTKMYRYGGLSSQNVQIEGKLQAY